MNASSEQGAEPDQNSSGSTELRVAHLIRRANGLAAFQGFLDSYSRHPAGASHELVLLLKGFHDVAQTRPYRSAAARLRPHWLEVPDEGFDLGAYRFAAENLDARLLCCLNSYSRPLEDGWLSRLSRPHSDRAVGVTGIGGSYESAYSSAPFWLRRSRRMRFPPFPNPHLRSNGFMLARELLLDLDWPPPTSKADAWALESGTRSMSRQIWQRDLEVLVVGRDGVAYPPERWRESATFRSGDQRNLLIADNRTRQYETAKGQLRSRLEQMSWGAPGAPAAKRPSDPRPAGA
jgi:hypothetical protein